MALGAAVTLRAQTGQTLPTSRGVQPARLATLARRHGERWAVVIGISSYADKNVTPLRYAHRDARSFYDFLLSDGAGLGGFKRENVRLLIDADATTRNIRVALREFLKSATSDDVVYIYFAGHGAPDPDRTNDLYLVAYDTRIDSIASTGVPMSDISEATRRVYAQDLIVIVDACHSGGVGDVSGTRGEITNAINKAFLERLASTAPSKVVMTASEESQVSREGPQWGGGHGVFTHFLLQGLQGGADEEGDGDGIVTLGELFEYARSHVSRETRNAQLPTISQTAFDRDWPMALVDRGIANAAVASQVAAPHEPQPEQQAAVRTTGSPRQNAPSTQSKAVSEDRPTLAGYRCFAELSQAERARIRDSVNALRRNNRSDLIGSYMSRDEHVTTLDACGNSSENPLARPTSVSTTAESQRPASASSPQRNPDTSVVPDGLAGYRCFAKLEKSERVRIRDKVTQLRESGRAYDVGHYLSSVERVTTVDACGESPENPLTARP